MSVDLQVDSKAVKRRAFQNKKIKGIFTKVFSVLILLVVWWIAALFLSDQVVPGPGVVFETLAKNAASGALLTHFLITMQRVIIGFVLSMLLGILIGAAMGLSRKIEGVVSIWIMIALAIPSLCYLVIAYILLGLNEFATIVAVAITGFPMIAISVWQGVKDVDNRLLDMARVFNFSPMKRFTKVIVPQILPYIIASSRSGLGLIWKIVVIAELLGRNSGIGFQLNYWFQLFNMAQVFAWTVFATIIVVLIEVFLFAPLEKKVFHWRPEAKL